MNEEQCIDQSLDDTVHDNNNTYHTTLSSLSSSSHINLSSSTTTPPHHPHDDNQKGQKLIVINYENQCQQVQTELGQVSNARHLHL